MSPVPPFSKAADTQHHTTANHTIYRMPPGYHVYGGARDSRGNSGQKTAMRNTHTHSSLSPPPAVCLCHTLEAQRGRRAGAHSSRDDPRPSRACTQTLLTLSEMRYLKTSII